jgi:flagellar biosynthesis protein FlgN
VDTGVCREHIEKLLIEESAALTRLEGLLDKEHEFLIANDIEELDRAGEARQACMGDLLRVEDERRSLCRMMNVPTDVKGLERLMTWCDPSRKLQKRWSECSTRAGRCRDLNDRNGALVAARLKRVEGLLDVLTGRANQPKVYGPQGGYESSGRAARVLATV